MAKLNEMYKTPITALLLAACLVSAALIYAVSGRAVAASPPGSVHADGFAITNLSAKAVWVVEGEQGGAEFARAVASAGDVNADGYADVIVGAPRYDLDEYKGGAAFVYYGTQDGLPSNANWIGGGEIKGSRYGQAVASAGDVNGDGYDDVVIGAYRYKNGAIDTEEGAAFLYYGSEDGLSTSPAWIAEFDQPYAQLGYAVTGAGDLNRDGFDDVVVGVPFYDNDLDNEGAVFVYYGSRDGLNLEPDLIIEGNQTDAGLGTTVGMAGDVNGDGYDDLVVGAPNFDYEEADAGAAFVHYGSKYGLDKIWDWRVISDIPDSWFGISVGTAGDVDNDGYADVIVGAPQYEYEPASFGSAFVYYGSSEGPQKTDAWQMNSGQSLSWFGTSVGTAGDVDNDGYDDVIIGAYKYRDDQPDEGGAFVYLGTQDGLKTYYSWWAAGDKIETSFGYSVASAGDINADGADDVIVGAYTYKMDKILLGRAYLFLGEQSQLPLPTEGPPLSMNVFLPLLTR